MNPIEIFVLDENSEERLDVYLSMELPSFSRSKIQQLIKHGHVLVNGKKEKPSFLVQESDRIHLSIPEPTAIQTIPQNIPIELVFEDDHIIIVNKPKGMVVHPAPGNYTDTLVNALLYHCSGRLSSINGIIRPGIVHRIDKDTSGILIIAKTDEAHTHLADQFFYHSITRVYEMIVFGNPKDDDFTIDQPIARNTKDRKKMAISPNGKNAVTHFHLLKKYNGFTHMQAQLETGRTHQIRVHAAFARYPLVGDHTYSNRTTAFNTQGQCLHAKTLGFIHPTTKNYMEFTCEPPDSFKHILKILESKYPLQA